MKFLSYNPGHDGAVAFVEDCRLVFSVEAEKDSNYRYSAISIAEVLDAVGQLSAAPDVICMSGWWPRDHHEFLHRSHKNGGYRGVSAECAIMDKGRLLGGRADYFSSSHERSHLLCAFGMSPFPKGTPCYALIWEGEIGSFYEIDPDLNITLIADVMSQPGNRYGRSTAWQIQPSQGWSLRSCLGRRQADGPRVVLDPKGSDRTGVGPDAVFAAWAVQEAQRLRTSRSSASPRRRHR